jgi:hypothetical protein
MDNALESGASFSNLSPEMATLKLFTIFLSPSKVSIGLVPKIKPSTLPYTSVPIPVPPH